MEDDAERLRAQFADVRRAESFGGVYIDHATGGRLVLLRTDGVRTDDLIELSHPDRLDVRVVGVSYSHLSELYWRIADALVRFDPAVAGITATYVDVRTNQVVVELVPGAISAELPRAASEAFGTEDIEVRIATEVPTGAGFLQNDPNAPPVYGGHSWTQTPSGSSTGLCTLGFEVNITHDTSTAYMLTAAHCKFIFNMQPGQIVYHGGTHIGNLNEWSLGGSRDFQLIRMVSHATTSDDVWHGLTNPVRRDVVGTSTGYGEGDVRCFTGMFTGFTKCGAILQSSWSGNVFYTNVGSLPMTDLVKHEPEAKGGDSGGPFYRVTSTSLYASGILSAKSDTETYHVKWPNIPPTWQVTLATN